MRNKYSVNSHNHNRSIYSKLENVAKTFYNVENFLQRRSNIILTHCARWNVFGGPQTQLKGPLRYEKISDSRKPFKFNETFFISP